MFHLSAIIAKSVVPYLLTGVFVIGITARSILEALEEKTGRFSNTRLQRSNGGRQKDL
jgi:hypothetical protein